MKTIAHPLVTLVLSLGMTAFSGFGDDAATVDTSRLADHLESQIPPHFSVTSTDVKLIGSPVQLARLNLMVTPVENLYREIALEAPVPSVEVTLPDQLLATRPAIRFLKLASEQGRPIPTIRTDIGVTNQGGVWTFGTIPVRFFENAGLPQGLCKPGLATEDSPEGKAQMAEFTRRSAQFAESVQKFRKSAKLEKAGQLFQSVAKTGLDIANPFLGGNAGGTTGANNAEKTVKEVLNVIMNPEAPTPVSNPPTSEAKPTGNAAQRIHIQQAPAKAWQISTNKLNHASKVFIALSQHQ